MKIKIKPKDFLLPYKECPQGLFLCGGMIGLKSEYGGSGYCDTGEAFSAEDSMVIPLEYEIILEALK